MLRIKELRQEKKMTQSELAKLLSTTTANISGWETEKWQPDISNLIKMSEIFECSIDYLVGRETENGVVYSVLNLSENEKYFLEILRKLDVKERNILIEIAKILLINK